MPNETPPPAPTPPPQLPPLGPIIGQLLLAFISSPWLRAIITAVMAAFGTVYLVKQSLPAVPEQWRKGLPHILPRPQDPAQAIGKIRFGNSGCTATIIGPVMSNDTRLDILTAAHCVQVGAKGTMQLKDGRVLAVRCVSRDAASDAAWLIADKPEGLIPYLLLADEPPNEGDAVWHQGYGIDQPGNRESGKFLGVQSSGQQCRFRLSVSPGDSGGGIILDAAHKVISPVCCTTRLSGVGEVFGAAPGKSAAIRPRKGATEEPEELVHPILAVPEMAPMPALAPPAIR